MRIRIWLSELKYWRWERPKEHAMLWIIGKLPHQFAMRTACRVIAHATTGQWSNQVVPELTAMEALKRWDIPHAK